MPDFKSPRAYLRALLVQALRENKVHAVNIYTQANGVKAWFVRAHEIDQISNVVVQLTRAVAPFGYAVRAAHKDGARGRSIYVYPDHKPYPQHVPDSNWTASILPAKPQPRVCPCCHRPL